jgi:hypothetical protein
MANIPVNFGGVILTGTQSTTGSFAGVQSLGSGSAAGLTNITGSTITFKYGAALSATGTVIESGATTITLPAGITVPLFITSCSLAAGSAPVILYT